MSGEAAATRGPAGVSCKAAGLSARIAVCGSEAGVDSLAGAGVAIVGAVDGGDDAGRRGRPIFRTPELERVQGAAGPSQDQASGPRS